MEVSQKIAKRRCIIFGLTCFTFALGILALFAMNRYSTIYWNSLASTRWYYYKEKELDSKSIQDYNYFNESLLKHPLHEQKTILIWNEPFRDFSMVSEFIQEYFSVSDDGMYVVNSPICGHCVITRNRTKFSTSEAVVFHSLEATSKDVPTASHRRPDQLYVWWFQESTSTTKLYGQRRHMYDFFNMTMSVRRSSDIYSPYSSFPFVLKMIWSKKNGNDLMENILRGKGSPLMSESTLQNIMKNFPGSSRSTVYSKIPETVSIEIHDLLLRKNRMIMWLVSNCGVSLRHLYFTALRRNGLQIDQFGKCGMNFPVNSRWDPAFYEVISRYKFYLAMENSYHCKDYLTEKLWFNALYSGAVPVIFGPHKDDIAAVLPPKSYIHAEDFSSPAELVQFLKYLDKNHTAYAEYLEWRSLIRYLDDKGNYHPSILQKSNSTEGKVPEESFKTLVKFAIQSACGFCELCRTVHTQHEASKIIHSALEWYGIDRSECLNMNLARRMSGV